MPIDYTDLSQAVSALKGLHDGTIDPETINLPEDDNKNEPPTDDSQSQDAQGDQDDIDNQDKKDDDSQDDNKDQNDDIDQKDDQDQQDKKVQTPEENRKFAEQRRQQELEKRVQEELDKRVANSPEYQVAKLLSEQFGVTPEELVQQVQLGKLQEQNPNVPVELLQQQMMQQQQTATLQEQLANLQYQLWERDVKQEASEVQKEFPVLTNDDLQSTIDYMLGTIGNTNIPFKQAVMAVHGEKIMESLKTQARNEVLAEKSGRKSPLVPQEGKSDSTPQLTDEERYIAKAMGVSEEDYLKYK